MHYLNIMDFVEKVRQTIDRYALIVRGDSVLVALSGGPDSVALLNVLKRFQAEMKLELRAVYINHQIRPDQVANEERFCGDLCQTLGVPLEIVSENIPELASRLGKGLEETGRDFRYRTFERLAEEHSHQRIALGHHYDDRAETVLFRLIRGSGMTGLTGIPVRRGRIIRPLYDVRRDEILSYLRDQSLEFVVDESNDDNGFKRNFIRNELLPTIRENISPGVDGALVSLSEIVTEENAYLDRIASNHFKKLVARSPGGKIELDLDKFNSYDKWLRRRLLRRCLTELSVGAEPPAKDVVDGLDRFCLEGGKAISLAGQIQARMSRLGRLVLIPPGELEFSLEMSCGVRCRLDRPDLLFKCSVKSGGKTRPEKLARSRRIRIDADKVLLPLRVRSIDPGDRFSPLGMKGSKKVGDYLTDKKIEPVFRDEIPVVCDNKGIIWLVGLEIADRVEVTKSTKEVLEIEFSQPRKYRVKAV